MTTAVGAPGYRCLLRFDTVLMNRGDGDLVVGDRSDPTNPYAPYFVFHECHGHYHGYGRRRPSGPSLSERVNSSATLLEIVIARPVSNPALYFQPRDAKDFSNEARSVICESEATSVAC